MWHKVAHFIGGARVHPFEALALEAFRFQFRNNALYGEWCRYLGWTAERVAACSNWRDIPMLPVEAFRWGRVRTEGIVDSGAPVTFRTSGTTGTQQGVHEVHTPGLYAMSATAGFPWTDAPNSPTIQNPLETSSVSFRACAALSRVCAAGGVRPHMAATDFVDSMRP